MYNTGPIGLSSQGTKATTTANLRPKVWTGAKLETASNCPVTLGLHSYIVRLE